MILKICILINVAILTVSCANFSDLNKRLKSELKKNSVEVNVELLEKFAGLSLKCIDKTYPYKPGVVLYKKQDLIEPIQRHPIFYGCYDWHSAVHGHWALVKILNNYPEFPLRSKIVKKLGKHFTKYRFDKEAKFFKTKPGKTFERPYGYGWLLRLIEELDKSTDPQMKKWRANSKALEKVIAGKMMKYFETFKYPNRVGTHGNSAFAMSHAWDYALRVQDQKLLKAISNASDEWFAGDTSCPMHIEPSGGDFVSPCLAVAHLMAKIKSDSEFISWFDKYMPSLSDSRVQNFFFPPRTKDIKDPIAGHLVGLTFQRTWSMKSILKRLPQGHVYHDIFLSSRNLHLQSGVEQMFDTGYGGTHWLASFAIHATLSR